MDRGVGAAARLLPGSDRKDLAIQALAGSETVSDLAARHGVSRKFVHQLRFHTREEARTAVFEYIEVFYNRQRLHSAIGYRTPAEARASMEGITMRAAE